MFGENQFIEVPVIGLLLLFGIAPLLILAVQKWREETGFCPPLARIAALSEKGAGVALLVVLAFVVGMIGNQVLDAVIDDEWTIGFDDYESLYAKWREEKKPHHLDEVPTLKIAEHHVAKDNEYTRAYLARHKSFVRVMRAAAGAAVLLLITMAIYEIAARKHTRYRPWQFAVTAVAIALFIFAYLSEVAAVNRRVFELATHTRAKVAKEDLGLK